MEEQKGKTKKVTVGFILSWAIGTLSVAGGILYLFTAPISGLLYFLLAFVLLPPANELVEKKLKFSISGGLKFILVVVLLVIIGTTLSNAIPITESLSKSNNNSAKVQSGVNNQSTAVEQKEFIKISAEDLYQEYQDNSVAADQKYDGKQIEVTGSIYDFGTEILGRPYITFGFLETQAIFSKSYSSQLAELQKGQEITVQCKVSGAPLGYPILDNCRGK